MYIGYVDESGDQSFITHTAVLIPADRWVSCWNIWMNWRRTLRRKYGIPECLELHCSPFLHGNFDPLPRFELRGRMVDAAVNTSAGLQRQVIQDCMRERRVIEEPWMRESHEAQFVQVADLAAHLACHAVRRDNGDHGSWDWYGLFLTERLVWNPGTADGIFWP